MRPTLASITPDFGTYGTVVTLTGTHFGDSRGSSKVWFNDVSATILSWSYETIVTEYPPGSTSGDVHVTVDGYESNQLPYRVFGVQTVSPGYAMAGDTVRITGTGFGFIQGTNHVTVGGVEAPVISWSDDEILFEVVEEMSTSDVVVSVDGLNSNVHHLIVGSEGDILNLLLQTNCVSLVFVGYTSIRHCTEPYGYPLTCDTTYGCRGYSVNNYYYRQDYPIVWEGNSFSMSRWLQDPDWSYSLGIVGSMSDDGIYLNSISGGSGRSGGTAHNPLSVSTSISANNIPVDSVCVDPLGITFYLEGPAVRNRASAGYSRYSSDVFGTRETYNLISADYDNPTCIPTIKITFELR
jgi:hypothetical protein